MMEKMENTPVEELENKEEKNKEQKEQEEKFPALAEVVDFEKLEQGRQEFKNEMVKFLAGASYRFLSGVKDVQEGKADLRTPC